MTKFIMLCGLPASGKSTLAKDLFAKYNNALVLSSDNIREQLFGDVNNQENNAAVFEEMNKRTKHLLENGLNVIYDATNINRKRRMHLINHEIKADEKIVHCIVRCLGDCITNDQHRERSVGSDVIKRMYKNFQLPTKNEGWDEVIFHNTFKMDKASIKKHLEYLIENGLDHDRLFDKLKITLPIFEEIIDVPQDSSYHSFSISRHTYYVYKYILDNYNQDDKLMMLWVALFHDLGKGFCKSFINYKCETQRYANFIGHEYVSAQLASIWLYALDYDDQFIKNVVDLIQFHMVPMKASDKKMNEVKRLLGDDLFEKLMILHEADMQAK